MCSLNKEKDLDIKALKKDTRELIKKDLADINDDVRDFLSEKLAQSLIKLDEVKGAKNIMMFLSFAKELNTDFIFHELKKMGKNIFVPITDRTSKKLLIEEIDSLDSLETNYMGIREPKTSSAGVDPQVIDLIITPGVAFDENLNRIGYGGGYYDKLFDDTRSDAPKLAICFDEQIISRVPVEDHDHKMDLILSPSKLIRPKK